MCLLLATLALKSYIFFRRLFPSPSGHGLGMRSFYLNSIRLKIFLKFFIPGYGIFPASASIEKFNF